MVAVSINGQSSELKTDGLTNIADVIELVKSVIDPDHMITAILLDGRDLEEHEWSASPSQFTTSIIEISTGTPQTFVYERMSKCPEIVRSCFWEFKEARERFQDGQMQEANKKLVDAVNTLQAFFEWYATLMDLVPDHEKARFDMSALVTDISEICKRICQQQLYQSWWALGESLKNELEPKIEELEKFTRQVSEQAQC